MLQQSWRRKSPTGLTFKDVLGNDKYHRFKSEETKDGNLKSKQMKGGKKAGWKVRSSLFFVVLRYGQRTSSDERRKNEKWEMGKWKSITLAADWSRRHQRSTQSRDLNRLFSGAAPRERRRRQRELPLTNTLTSHKQVGTSHASITTAATALSDTERHFHLGMSVGLQGGSRLMRAVGEGMYTW